MSKRVRFRPIGETFVDGLGRKLQVREAKFSSCKGCVNCHHGKNLPCIRLKDYSGFCSDIFRGDRKNVIFVEVKGDKNHE